MTLENRLLKFGVKGIMVTDKPFIIEGKRNEQRFRSLDDIEEHLWYKAKELSDFKFVNYNLLDEDFKNIMYQKDCIDRFNELYNKKKHKKDYEKLLGRYANMFWNIETPYDDL